MLVFGRELGRINPEPASSRFCSCPSPDALWPTRHNRLQSLLALRAELAEGPLCAPAVAVTITASNVETGMRPLRFMDRKVERIEVANLDFIRFFSIRFFSSCGPCRPQRHPKANTFLAMLVLTEEYAAKNQCLQEK